MARMFAYVGNRADLIRCAVSAEHEGLERAPDATTDGWGVGFYQGGDVLVRKRPNDARVGLAMVDCVKGLRTDCAVVHHRVAGLGDLSMENTHPFRHRHWLFAHNGTVPGFESFRAQLVDRLPDFLRTSMLGQTDSEVLFHLFLGFVHRTGRLHDPELERRVLIEGVNAVVSQVDALTDAAGLPRAPLNLLLTNSVTTLALRRGLPLAWVRRNGIKRCTACAPAEPRADGRAHAPTDHNTFRYVMVASDHPVVPAGWHDVPTSARGTALVIDRNLDAVTQELG